MSSSGPGDQHVWGRSRHPLQDQVTSNLGGGKVGLRARLPQVGGRGRSQGIALVTEVSCLGVREGPSQSHWRRGRRGAGQRSGSEGPSDMDSERGWVRPSRDCPLHRPPNIGQSE